jgi:hypothetical protein
MKKGISLILLVITIIIIIILSGSIILTILPNNVISDSKATVQKGDFKTIADEFNLYKSNLYAKTDGKFDMSSINADSTNIGTICKTAEKYKDVFRIVNGYLEYTGNNSTEKALAKEYSMIYYGTEKTGTNISFSNTIESTIPSLTIYGKSTQNTTVQGKNLLNDSLLQNNKDINISTGLITEGLRTIMPKPISVVPGNTYTLRRPVAVRNMGLRIYDINGMYLNSPGFSTTNTYTYTIPSNVYYLSFIDEANTLTQGYQLEIGSVFTTYEPFIPNSPSPEYPSTINSAGMTKNVFNINTVSNNKRLSSTGTEVDDSLRNISDYIYVNGNANISMNLGSNYAFYDQNKNYISGDSTKSMTIFRNYPIPSNAYYFRFDYQKSTVGSTLIRAVFGNYTEANLPTYEPYGSQVNLICEGDNIYSGQQQFTVTSSINNNTGFKFFNNYKQYTFSCYIDNTNGTSTARGRFSIRPDVSSAWSYYYTSSILSRTKRIINSCT